MTLVLLLIKLINNKAELCVSRTHRMGANAIQWNECATARQHFMHANKSLYAHALTQSNEIKLKMHSRCTSSLHSWSYARGKLVWPRRDSQSAYNIIARSLTTLTTERALRRRYVSAHRTILFRSRRDAKFDAHPAETQRRMEL